MIYPCTCSNEWQDKTYGKKNRVHNICVSSNPGQQKIRCTVCKGEKLINK